MFDSPLLAAGLLTLFVVELDIRNPLSLLFSADFVW